MSAITPYPLALDAYRNALVFEWLAGIFVSPLSQQAVDNYRQEIGAVLFHVVLEDPECAAGVRLMRSALHSDGSSIAVVFQLSRAFTELFDGVGSPKPVSLYESAHLGTSGRLFQEPSGRMAKLLRQLNVSIHTAFCEPPDHVSIELALLGRLIRQGAGQREQSILLDGHLLVWLPGFVDQCRESDRTGFYSGAAQVLMVVLANYRIGLEIGLGIKNNSGATL